MTSTTENGETPVDEGSPLLDRHISIEGYVPSKTAKGGWRRWHGAPDRRARRSVLSATFLLLTSAAVLLAASEQILHWRRAVPPPTPPPVPPSPNVVPISSASESNLHLGDGLSLWYRTWGNRETGTPVLFVHGGPGNSVADYGKMNAYFFDFRYYFVVESDQRGTGKSKPSVWDDPANMERYRDVSIDQMASDFETLREALGIDAWLVFGGSWGSTLGIDYAERHPSRCLGLIVRGVYLNTEPEFEAIYSRKPFEDDPDRLANFNAFLAIAEQEAERSGEVRLDPNDAERIVRLYWRMILRGDRTAIWTWYVFEVNLMEEDPAKLLDFNVVEESDFKEATGVAFFETTLFLRGTYDNPIDLLGNVGSFWGGANGLPVHTWVCQGRRDQVCPDRYARELVESIQDAGLPMGEHFVDDGHQASGATIAQCLKDRVEDFAEFHASVESMK